MDVGCQFLRGHCIRTTHAEVNAIEWARKVTKGVRFPEATLYVTGSPCPDCREQIIDAGIPRVVYRQPYRGEHPEGGGVEWVCWGWGGKER